ncbi:dihydrolipoyl dehydrogenase [Stella sp.]|uniref:dihydrolipoyl dehydrogenase n=1 Tax=Stella sp. TaxID=2912054 RepID=UPI0035B07D4B
MAEETFDLVVIGGGPGGYVAAIRAAQLGLRVACVEKDATLGGTCLNVGCIPSKALLDSSEKFAEVGDLARQGVVVEKVSLDLAAMMAWKDKAVADNTRGIDFLFKKNKVERVWGTGRIAAPGEVVATGPDGAERRLAARNILIATGSEVTPLPGVAIDEQRIVSSTGALSLPAVPKRLVVVGGGIIGLELGSVWRRLGSEVTVIEFLDRITPGIDLEVAKTLQRTLARQGLKFRLGTKVTSATPSEAGVTLTVEPAAGGAAETLECDVVLVAIGRRPYTAGLGLEALGIALDRGRVPIDDHFRTSVPGIYAIGDVVRGPMLAHKAEDEGVVAAEIIAGQSGHIDYNAIPGVVYTWPEVATVGRSEDDLKAAGIAYKVGKFPFTANGRARCVGETDGFVKILADARTEKVLGVHIIGPDAGTLIAECVLAMEYGASAEDIARTCHAHPTLNEAVKEAALAVDGRALHI